MDLQILWFILWGVLWAVYFALDGFVLGAGMLQGFLSKNKSEKKAMLDSIGPVWNGNEVWLLTAGGATFAAFPTTYAYMFSYLYTALLIILFALILRGVSVEFRGKAGGETWEKGWDLGLLAGSLVPALLFGVAFGNIFQGLPIDAGGYHGSLLDLLNPYGLLAGVLFVLLFVVHGALWVSVKTTGDLAARASKFAGNAWYALLLVAVAFLAYTASATSLYDNYLDYYIWFVVPAIAVLALLAVKLFTIRGNMLAALAASGLTIITVVFTGIVGLYPNLIPSSLDSEFSLTIRNTSSSNYTLTIMAVVAFIFVPIVIAYQAWIYGVFWRRFKSDDSGDSDPGAQGTPY
jgi:cytochrome d ubiquinol oxidase subunit II